MNLKVSFLIIIIFTSFNCTKKLSLTVKELWRTKAVFATPESVLYNAKEKILYVSNINGKPIERNKKGYISKLSLEGTVLNQKWITGLNAPKGMGMYKRFLYVTDIDSLVKIDIASGKIQKRYGIMGAIYLNDIAIDNSGKVYISDMKTRNMFIFDGKSVSHYHSLPDGTISNGLFIEKEYLFVGTNRGVMRINLKNKKIRLMNQKIGGIDGLKKIGKKMFITSDWKGKVEIVKNGNVAILIDTTSKKVNAADFEYIPKKKLIIIPTFFDNRVVAYSLNGVK